MHSPHPLLRQAGEYAGTFGAQFLVLFGQLVAFKLAAALLGMQGFAEFTMSRRTLSVLQPVTWMGLGVALPRFLADVRASADIRGQHYAATVVTIGAVTLVCAVVMNVANEWSANLFFGARTYSHLVFPLSLMLVGMGAHAVAYSYFRGMLHMASANSLYVLNLAVVPLTALVFAGQRADTALAIMGVLWSVTSLIWFFRTPWRAVGALDSARLRDILRYGLPRMPGQLAAMALLTAPATFATHRHGIVVGGFVAFGTSILGMFAAAFNPVSLVLLPRARQMLTSGTHAELRQHVGRLLYGTAFLSALATLALLVFGAAIVEAYLGAEFAAASNVVRVSALGIVPYTLYIVSRALIDASYHRAVTTYNVVAALLLFGTLVAALSGVSDSPILIVAALVAALCLLAVLCLWATVRALRGTAPPGQVPTLPETMEG